MPVATANSAQVLEQAVEVVQSQHLIQTTVCAIISTVAYLRDLFPRDCFRTHYYDVEDPSYSYKDFISPTNKDLTMAVRERKLLSHKCIPLDTLVRGKDKGADKLLDWIVGLVTESCSLD
jgi:hypothetical protein